MHSLQEVELLYRRLGFTVRPEGDVLRVEKVVAGTPHKQCFGFYDSKVSDPYEFVDKMEQVRSSESVIIIFDKEASVDDVTVLKEFSERAYSLDGWLNQMLNSRRICNDLMDTKVLNIKEEETDNVLSREYVEPLLSPVDQDTIIEWAREPSGEDEQSLGNVVVLSGPAGFGKTTVTREIARRFADTHLSDEDNPFPIFISLESFRTERKWEDLLRSYSERYNIPEITPDALQYIIERERAFLIVDGLDELAERGGMDAATQTLAEFARAVGSRGRLLATARDIYLSRFRRVLNESSTSFISIKGVSPESRLQLISGSRQDIRRQMSSLLKEDKIKSSDLATNPLFIITVAQAIASRKDSIDFNESAAQVLVAALDQMHEREVERQKLPINAIQYREILGDLSIDTLERGASGEEEDNLSVPEGLDYIDLWIDDHISPGSTLAESEQRKRLVSRSKESLRSHPVFDTEKGLDSAELRFRNPFFRDALSAIRIIDLISQRESINLVPQVAGESATEYIMALLRGQPDLVDKVLAESEPNSAVSFAIPVKAKMLLAKSRVQQKPIESSKIRESWSDLHLGGLNFNDIRFYEVSFTKTILSGVRFVRCEFIDCDMQAAVLTDAIFDSCVASEGTLNQIKTHGVDPPELASEAVDLRSAIQKRAEEFASIVVEKFFRKFVRERNRNKRSVKYSVFTRGVDLQQGVFTSQKLIDLMLRHKVVEHDRHSDVVIFNADFQKDIDMLLFENKIIERFKPIFEDVVNEAQSFLV